MAKLAILLCLTAVLAAFLAQANRQEITRGRPLEIVNRHDANRMAGRQGASSLRPHQSARLAGRRGEGRRNQGGGHHGLGASFPSRGGLHSNGRSGLHRVAHSLLNRFDAKVEGIRRNHPHRVMENLRADLGRRRHGEHRSHGFRRQGRGQGHRGFPDRRTVFNTDIHRTHPSVSDAVNARMNFMRGHGPRRGRHHTVHMGPMDRRMGHRGGRGRDHRYTAL